MVLQGNFVLQLHPLQGLLGVQTAQGGDKAVAQGDGSHGGEVPAVGGDQHLGGFQRDGGGERVGQSDDLAARPVEVGYDVIGGAGVPGIGDDQQAVLRTDITERSGQVAGGGGEQMDVVTHLLEHEGQIVGRGIGGTHPGDIDGPGLMQDLLGAGKGIPQLGRDNFFPGSSDSTDKGFLGYLATCIEAPCDMRGQISLVCRKSPATPERMKLNGEEILFTEEEDKKDVILREGSNFLLIDISGYHQRFNMNYYFEFPYPLSFQAPCRGKEDSREKSGFVTVGPFQAGNILNIAAIDKPLDFENPDYQAVWEVEDVNGLQKFAEVLQAVMGDHCITKNPHMLTMTDRVLKKLPIPGDMRYMVLQSPQPFVLEASEQEVRITIDFGEELSGLFGFDLDAPEGVIIDADFAECYNQQQFEFSKDMNSGFRYYTRKGRQRYESHLRRGFRYALLTFRNLTADTAVYGIQTTELSYPELKRGSFTCSDWELNQIWQISRRSVELCMEDTFVDCPAFEQACWIGDARIEALVSYYTHGAYELTKNSIGMVGGSLRQSELPDAQVPTGCSTMITAWLLLWLLSCKEYYEYTGDMNGLDAVYDDMLLTIRRLDRHMNEDGLLEIDGWNMLDWAGMDTPVSGVVTHQNALLVKVLRETGDIARIREENRRP